MQRVNWVFLGQIKNQEKYGKIPYRWGFLKPTRYFGISLELSHLGENKHEQPGKLKNSFTYNRNKVKVNFEI